MLLSILDFPVTENSAQTHPPREVIEACFADFFR